MNVLERVFSVSEITRLIRGLLETEFPLVTVEGEISNFRPSSTGHCYFNLKDREAILSVVMFRSRLPGLAFQPADGMKVRATGSISVYPRRGSYQLICESLLLSGEGELLALLERRKQELAAKGLFEAARKKPLPLFPRRVAVVTSPTGAAIRDILRVLKRRSAGLNLVILPTPVQGDGAAATIARQIETANRHHLGEVLIVTRGGGSLEDLLPFSEEEVVYAIAGSGIPVISAVGHEIDTTLSDLAADARAPTPSAAAEMVCASRLELLKRVQAMASSIRDGLLSRLERVRLLVAQFSRENLGRNFSLLLQPQQQALDEARQELADAMRTLLLAQRHRLELVGEGLRAASPLEILRRGYSVVVHQPTGRVVTDAALLKPQDSLDVRFHKGGATAVVKERRE